jgi:hypothetical protein
VFRQLAALHARDAAAAAAAVADIGGSRKVGRLPEKHVTPWMQSVIGKFARGDKGRDKDEDKYEEFYEEYGYEPDEQSRDVQEKSICKMENITIKTLTRLFINSMVANNLRVPVFLSGSFIRSKTTFELGLFSSFSSTK